MLQKKNAQYWNILKYTSKIIQKYSNCPCWSTLFPSRIPNHSGHWCWWVLASPPNWSWMIWRSPRCRMGNLWEIYGKSSGNPWGGCQWLEINPMIWVLVEVQGNSDYDLQLRSLLDGTAGGILRWHAWTGGWWHSMGISAKAGGIQRSKDQSSEHISGIKPKKNLRGVDMEPNMLLFQHFQPRSCTIFVGGFRLRGSNA